MKAITTRTLHPRCLTRTRSSHMPASRAWMNSRRSGCPGRCSALHPAAHPGRRAKSCSASASAPASSVRYQTFNGYTPCRPSAAASAKGDA